MIDDTPPSRPPIDDEQSELLMKRVSEGDESAFDEMLRLWWPEIARYAGRLVGAPAAGEDIAQQTFLRVWEGRSRWKAGGSPRAYVYRVARNIALNERRRLRIRRRWGERFLHLADSPGPRTPEQVREGREVAAAVAAALAGLPPRRREVFELVRFHSLSYREVAVIMRISSQTVANQMSAALRSLRDSLSDVLHDTSDAPTAHPSIPPQRTGAGGVRRT